MNGQPGYIPQGLVRDGLPPTTLTSFRVTDARGPVSQSSGPLSVGAKPGLYFFDNRRRLWIGGFYWNSHTGVAACWMAMSTNIIALVLRLRSEKALSMGRRVGRHFVRTLESGALFAIIWLLMVIHHTVAGDATFETTDGFSFFVNGALISLLGSGAVLIILLAVTGYSETALLGETAYDEQGIPLSRDK